MLTNDHCNLVFLYVITVVYLWEWGLMNEAELSILIINSHDGHLGF
jgi:hypothetical protein